MAHEIPNENTWFNIIYMHMDDFRKYQIFIFAQPVMQHSHIKAVQYTRYAMMIFSYRLSRTPNQCHRAWHIHTVFLLAQHKRCIFFLFAYMPYRKLCSNLLAPLIVLLAMGCWTIGYVKPCVMIVNGLARSIHFWFLDNRGLNKMADTWQTTF